MNRFFFGFVVSALGLSPSLDSAYAALEDRTVLVLDASGSMSANDFLGGTESQSRFSEAKKRMLDEAATLGGKDSGLVAFGHSGHPSCSGIETRLPLARHGLGDFQKTLQGITPLGPTPLVAAIQQARELLATPGDAQGARGRVLTFTDGMDTCCQNPLEEIQELKRKNPGLKVDIVGIRVSAEAAQQLSMIASITGGRFEAVGGISPSSDLNPSRMPSADRYQSLSGPFGATPILDPAAVPTLLQFGVQAKTPARPTPGPRPAQEPEPQAKTPPRAPKPDTSGLELAPTGLLP